jgi:dipeptidyl-peptidase-4
MIKIILSLILLLPLICNGARVNLYDKEIIEGWNVHVDEDIFKLEPKFKKEGLPNLKKALIYINKTLPKEFCDFAKKDGLKIFISPSYKMYNRTGMFFVPPEDGSFSTGLERIMSKSVVIIDKSIFMDSKNFTYYLIHELAHYYHFRVVGYNNREILMKFGIAKRDANYKIPYAINYNHMEFFAELSAMYFIMRGDLNSMDKEGVILMSRLWSKKRAVFDNIIHNTIDWKKIRAEEQERVNRMFPLRR